MDENREDAMLLGVLEVSIDVVRLSQDSLASEDGNKTLLWWTVFFLGTGTLVGWNSLIAGLDFFRISFSAGPDAAVWFTWTFEFATLLVLLVLS
eukprot:CAMPEP_0172203518 /NCGR_PEP_ID=MMETSP1050-20130122/31336_1 /TAXON_ID=233186 /ORGANISM="Cryptomonas curvata, Strain CCAP979/52" /LENGTH=93 /DNA_ID=CAMNT_0012881757 /DNA_START=27 /DNA_END=304 /DNA_ORIENTATION=+